MAWNQSAMSGSDENHPPGLDKTFTRQDTPEMDHTDLRVSLIEVDDDPATGRRVRDRRMS